MTIVQLAELVILMRGWQREYFRDRTPFALNQSKRYERQVDEALRSVLHDHPRQGQLFQEADLVFLQEELTRP